MARPISRTTAGILLTLGSAAFFGIYPATARYAYADGANASYIMLVTTAVRMAAFYLLCLATKKALFVDKAHTRQGAIGGFFQAVSIAGIFGALTMIPGPVMIIIVFTHTLMLLLFMAWRGETRLDAITLGTTIMALLGLTLVLDLWTREQSYAWLGMGLAFISALATAARLYIYGQEMKWRHPAVIGAENFIFSAAFLIPLALVFPPIVPDSATGHVYALVGAVTQAMATFCMFYGIAALGAFRFSLFLKLEPIFTALFAAILLHELLAPYQYLGMLTVLASLVAYQYAEAKRKPLPTKTDDPS